MLQATPNIIPNNFILDLMIAWQTTVSCTLENCHREFWNSQVRIVKFSATLTSKNPKILHHCQKSPARIPKFSATLKNHQQEFQNLQARIRKFYATLASENPKTFRHSRKSKALLSKSVLQGLLPANKNAVIGKLWATSGRNIWMNWRTFPFVIWTKLIK